MARKNIAYVPSSHLYLNNTIFKSVGSHDRRLSPYRFLKSVLARMGFDLNTYDFFKGNNLQVDYIFLTRIDYNLHILRYLKKKFPESKVIYIVTEEITVAPIHVPFLLDEFGFDAIITWNTSGFKKTNVFKYFYPNPHHKPALNLFSGPQDRNIDCVMIAANKKPKNKKNEQYTLRAKLAEELISFPGFRLFGNGWSHLAESPNYCGVLDQKKDILPQVKFGLAIENTSNEEGAITEKIFDFFFYGVVPIYAGAPDINHYIPSSCYVDYQSFSNTSELIQFVNSMHNDQYIAMQQNIYNFLCSVDFDQFSWRGYASAVHNALQSVESNEPKSLSYLTAFKMLTKLSPSFPLRYLIKRRAA